MNYRLNKKYFKDFYFYIVYRFKIQPQQKELRAYINIMLEILRQRISSDIEVVRRYKFQDNSTPCSLKSVPSPLYDNIYKANHEDISQVNFKQGINCIYYII